MYYVLTQYTYTLSAYNVDILSPFIWHVVILKAGIGPDDNRLIQVRHNMTNYPCLQQVLVPSRHESNMDCWNIYYLIIGYYRIL